MAKVTLEKVSKFYGDVEAVKKIDLEISDNEFLVLVGPSGCGKSSTLRMIAGLEEIDEGKIIIGEKIVNELEPRERNVSMVFQNYALYPHMTVEENLGFSLKIAGMKKTDIDTRVAEAAGILDIKEFLQRKPAQLSGGQRQRVAMGRAIVRRPDVFLFDEPLSNLDAKLRNQMRTEIKRLHQKVETTIVYVTHDQVEAMTLADRIVILNLGNIEQVGSPDEIYSNPSNIFVAQFIGTPKMNILKITDKDFLSNNEVKFLGNNIKFNEINLSKKNYYFGIRPEHFTISDDCEYKFKPQIDLTENLGNEKIAYIKIDGHDISAKIPTQNNTIDQIGFNTKNIFVFDEDGNRVRS